MIHVLRWQLVLLLLAIRCPLDLKALKLHLDTKVTIIADSGIQTIGYMSGGTRSSMSITHPHLASIIFKCRLTDGIAILLLLDDAGLGGGTPQGEVSTGGVG